MQSIETNKIIITIIKNAWAVSDAPHYKNIKTSHNKRLNLQKKNKIIISLSHIVSEKSFLLNSTFCFEFFLFSSTDLWEENQLRYYCVKLMPRQISFLFLLIFFSDTALSLSIMPKVIKIFSISFFDYEERNNNKKKQQQKKNKNSWVE